MCPKLNLLANWHNCNRCVLFCFLTSFIVYLKKKKMNCVLYNCFICIFLCAVFISSKWKLCWPIKWIISVIFKSVLQISQLYHFYCFYCYHMSNAIIRISVIWYWDFFIFSFWSSRNKMTKLNNILISFPGPTDVISSVIACSVVLLSDVLLWQYHLQPNEGSTWF